jgi:thiamine biosynthesis lipoprotein
LSVSAFALLAAVLLGFSGCAKPPPAQSEFTLGTVCTVNLFEGGSARVYREVFARFREIEERMSANLPDSELESINQNAGKEAVPVHGDLLELIEKARYYALISDGAFNPLVGPLVKLWGIGGDSPRVPAPEEIAALLPLLNLEGMEIDIERSSVFLKQPGMRLDLGAIAKGYAADEAIRIVRREGIERALIDLGGNVFVWGEKKDGSPWRIAVQNPAGERGEYLGIAAVRNKTVVTSGVYERYFEAEGTRYHHILSPETGFPVNNGLLSVTIIALSSLEADGLSTAVFGMGYEKGAALVESLENAEALFVFDDFTVRGTSGALRDFTLTNSRFTLEAPRESTASP